MGQIKAIVLDFDGVLAESNTVKDASFGEFFARYPDYSEAMETYHLAQHSKPRRFKFAHFVEEFMHRPGDTAMIDQMTDNFSALVSDRVIGCPQVAGAQDLLEEFSPRVPLYISSVTPQEELNRIVKARGVAPHIRQAFGDPPHRKIDAIGRILDCEGLRPDQVAFVGDSESDFQVARETGLVFFARDSGQPFSDSGLDLSEDLHGIAARLRPLI